MRSKRNTGHKQTYYFRGWFCSKCFSSVDTVASSWLFADIMLELIHLTICICCNIFLSWFKPDSLSLSLPLHHPSPLIMRNASYSISIDGRKLKSAKNMFHLVFIYYYYWGGVPRYYWVCVQSHKGNDYRFISDIVTPTSPTRYTFKWL